MGQGRATAAACRLLAVVIASATFVVGAGVSSYASTSTSYLGTINRERASRGFAPLQMNAELTRVASGWADRMAASRVLQHNPALESEVSNWGALGENVGDGATLDSLAHAFWMSAEHRANILGNYTQVGIAAARSDGRIWIAIVFRQPMHRVSTATTSVSRSYGHKVASRSSQRQSLRLMLSVGSRGSHVTWLQRVLGITADGVFGAQTRRAVVGFQLSHQLSGDGFVGPLTWAALLRAAT